MEKIVIHAEQWKKFADAGIDMSQFEFAGELPKASEGAEIKTEKPPNYADIVKTFPAVKLRRGVIFTYGKIIYNPDNVQLTRALYAHEMVHSRRQGVDDGPNKWWNQYLTEKKFRLAEELIAHQTEYLIAAEGAGRQVRRRALAQIAARLSGPLYGRMVALDKAKELIQGESNVAPV